MLQKISNIIYLINKTKEQNQMSPLIPKNKSIIKMIMKNTLILFHKQIVIAKAIIKLKKKKINSQVNT